MPQGYVRPCHRDASGHRSSRAAPRAASPARPGRRYDASMTRPPLPSPAPRASSAAGVDAGDRPGPLVSAAWLAAHIDDPDAVLLHVSPTRRVYARRHLPDAVFVPLHRDLARIGTDPVIAFVGSRPRLLRAVASSRPAMRMSAVASPRA